MGRHWRRGALAVVLVTCMAVPVTNAIARATKAASLPYYLPPKVVGAWNRNVTQANWSNYKQSGFPVGVWTIVVSKGGGVKVYTPAGYRPGCIATKTCNPDFSTSFFIIRNLTIASVPVCTTKGTYGWKASGRSLTLKAIADRQCGPREALFTGLWPPEANGCTTPPSITTTDHIN
jgi:hypothetical protein